jgi:hypothetical protein
MTDKMNIDELIRDAVRAEDLAEFDRLAEPRMPDIVVDLFRGRLRAYVIMFILMIVALTVGAIYCADRFLAVTDLPAMLRWGTGFLFCVFVALNTKNWYWMQMEHLATARTIKRVELLIAQLAADMRARG